ncbi:MAG: DUF5103 domain-containing protein [Bacteroidetes bacterium]|jgi:hypothetical protein|nr:DUF5103 domain-containing protein [Bacteroidota bacterium]
MPYYRLPSGVLAALLLLIPLVGCSGAQESSEGNGNGSANDRRAARETEGLRLQPTSPDVRTLQLFPHAPDLPDGSANRDREDELPVLALDPRGDVRQLKLEFDLMEPNGRPLSIYFYHADRTWRRDLIPSEYLTAFQRDDLLDYTPSRNTLVRYTHYTYTFPNNSIGFRVSGNYILRVTEQGRESEVLFEMPFFITEDVGSPELALNALPMPGQNAPNVQPLLTFSPPSSLEGNVFDYSVCFVRNVQYDGARCNDRPSLNRQPDLLFDLQRETSFPPPSADYVLDLSTLRTGGDIQETDLTTSPYRIGLEPDYARFPATSAEPFLNGQLVVSGAVRDVAEPDIAAEYVETTFRFVPPDEQRLPGGVMLTGSFNGWSFDLANQLDWVAERGRYEGTLLLKQGLYEYRYTSRNRQAQRELSNNLPRTANRYTAFIYFADNSLNTDRLLAVQGTRTR